MVSITSDWRQAMAKKFSAAKAIPPKQPVRTASSQLRERTKDERFEKKTSSNGKYYFVLKAGNGQVIGNSDYMSRLRADNGIESVKRNAPIATVSISPNWTIILCYLILFLINLPNLPGQLLPYLFLWGFNFEVYVVCKISYYIIHIEKCIYAW